MSAELWPAIQDFLCCLHCHNYPRSLRVNCECMHAVRVACMCMALDERCIFYRLSMQLETKLALIECIRCACTVGDRLLVHVCMYVCMYVVGMCMQSGCLGI